MKTHLLSHLKFVIPVLAVLAFGSCDDKKKKAVEVLECTGSCTCDTETRTCTCEGGTDCALEGDTTGVTFICDGNAACSLACGIECNVECNGTAGCSALMGDDSTAVCNGTGTCDYECLGDCVVDCPGASLCTIDCAPGATCEFTSCPQPEDCGDGFYACRAACPQ
jgi:hypothetical protein